MISSLKFGVHNSGLYEPRICALSDQLTEMCTFNYTGTPFLGRPVSPFNTFGADETRRGAQLVYICAVKSQTKTSNSE